MLSAYAKNYPTCCALLTPLNYCHRSASTDDLLQPLYFMCYVDGAKIDHDISSHNTIWIRPEGIGWEEPLKVFNGMGSCRRLLPPTPNCRHPPPPADRKSTKNNYFLVENDFVEQKAVKSENFPALRADKLLSIIFKEQGQKIFLKHLGLWLMIIPHTETGSSAFRF
uniref:Uncharacterized protein n=1 Tax=Romanomermis culicivorax TaxID=13658 RepID=A0A915K746_ROMCU